MGPWQPIDVGTPQPEALLLFYVPGGNYVWGTGKDRAEIKKEYPTVTHYKIVSEAP